MFLTKWRTIKNVNDLTAKILQIRKFYKKFAIITKK